MQQEYLPQEHLKAVRSLAKLNVVHPTVIHGKAPAPTSVSARPRRYKHVQEAHMAPAYETTAILREHVPLTTFILVDPDQGDAETREWVSVGAEDEPRDI
jgi:hypothetical protein